MSNERPPLRDLPVIGPFIYMAVFIEEATVCRVYTDGAAVH